ncbi:MAG: NAD-dependent epimerase/dehydratase family protein [Bryobacterales bacterium]|nr:NAD-dependent epimerase/dehydratase family protein [Bryobacterales bacterium]
MKVLVIGGTAFIGRLLVKELIRAGHDVTILHRRAEHPFGKRVVNLVADRNDPEAVRQAIAPGRFEAVFDLAYDWERGTAARHVDAAARACGDSLKRYVFMSSVAAYADGLNHHEGDALAPDDHPNFYARNKATSERLLFRLHQRYGLPVVTLRPPFVYGPENMFYREAFFWDRMRDKRPVIIPGDGRRLMQFVFVHDLVWTCMRVLEVPAAVGEAFNVANQRPVTQMELVEALARAARKTPSLVRVPRDHIQEAGGNPMGSPLYFGVYFDVPPITEIVAKAKRVLGFQPTDFDAGLGRTYRWYLRHYIRRPIDYSFEDRLISGLRHTENERFAGVAR